MKSLISPVVSSPPSRLRAIKSTILIGDAPFRLLLQSTDYNRKRYNPVKMPARASEKRKQKHIANMTLRRSHHILEKYMTEKVDILLRGGTVVTMNGKYEVFEDGAVAIRDDSIVAVGPTEKITRAYSAAEEIDCADTVVMPGLVNAHTHIPMTLMRGLNDDLR